ncbi:MAG: DNA polymerase III subunit epsilon [Rickettsiaceae bacterium]|nr:MAG: DNA polymerase III subunit epsilon [Rickettsiaceae bacterium]
MSAVREIILDTETTGLDPSEGHRIVEIGAIEMINKLATGNQFHRYINPQRDMPKEAYRIHGISGEFLKDKPLFVSIAEEFLAFIGDSKLIIHNAPFDIKFLNHELSLINKPVLKSSVAIDTLVMARKMLPGKKVNLDALCKIFKVDNSGRQLHGALKDAALLADVYIELTGGRQGMFTMSKTFNQQPQVSINMNTLAAVIDKNIIITPTKAELEKHKSFLAKINAPIW